MRLGYFHYIFFFGLCMLTACGTCTMQSPATVYMKLNSIFDENVLNWLLEITFDRNLPFFWN